jgi:hypothetical protein
MKYIIQISIALIAANIFNLNAAQLPRLRVSDNHRFIVTEQGEPFFWLGDTAWELFHRLNREEAIRYLDDRASKGFTVVQAVALAELNGLGATNAYGHLPLLENDPTKPDVKKVQTMTIGTTWILLFGKLTNAEFISDFCQPGATNGIKNGVQDLRFSIRGTLKLTDAGWDSGIAMLVLFGF